ncbi:MAG: hypothetical protein AAGE01_08935 [Pseudomonadota bacterium]
MATVRSLGDAFAILKPDLRVDTLDVTPEIYAQLDAEFAQFKDHVLISLYRFESDWPTWERHPAGNELVLLLSGSATLILFQDGERTEVVLDRPQQYVVVPVDCWHTAKVDEPTTMLFITPGEGSENVALPPGA